MCGFFSVRKVVESSLSSCSFATNEMFTFAYSLTEYVCVFLFMCENVAKAVNVSCIKHTHKNPVNRTNVDLETSRRIDEKNNEYKSYRNPQHVLHMHLCKLNACVSYGEKMFSSSIVVC